MSFGSGEDAAAEPAVPTRLPEIVRLLRGWVPIVAGVALLIACYLGVSDETEVSRQLPYLVSGGFGGLALIIVGSALLVIDGLATGGGRQQLARQVDDLHTLILSAADAPVGPPAVPATRPPGGYTGPAGGGGAPTATAPPAAWPGPPADAAPPDAAPEHAAAGGVHVGGTAEHGAHQAFDHGAVEPDGGTPGGSDGGPGWVAVAGGRTYHRPDCRLVEGKDTGPVAPADVEARGLTPCRLCTPPAA